MECVLSRGRAVGTCVQGVVELTQMWSQGRKKNPQSKDV